MLLCWVNLVAFCVPAMGFALLDLHPRLQYFSIDRIAARTQVQLWALYKSSLGTVLRNQAISFTVLALYEYVYPYPAEDYGAQMGTFVEISLLYGLGCYVVSTRHAWLVWLVHTYVEVDGAMMVATMVGLYITIGFLLVLFHDLYHTRAYWIHKTHHEHVVPVGITACYASHLEWFITVMHGAIAMHIFGPTQLQACLGLVVYNVELVWGHSGYDFREIARYHIVHHQNPKLHLADSEAMEYGYSVFKAGVQRVWRAIT